MDALLGALLLLALCALTLFLLDGTVGRTTVPVLRGLPRGGVEARAGRLHVQPAFSTRYSEAASGIAIAQDPSAGTRVKDGSTVGVVLSAGPPPVRVPGVVGPVLRLRGEPARERGPALRRDSRAGAGIRGRAP